MDINNLHHVRVTKDGCLNLKPRPPKPLTAWQQDQLRAKQQRKQMQDEVPNPTTSTLGVPFNQSYAASYEKEHVIRRQQRIQNEIKMKTMAKDFYLPARKLEDKKAKPRTDALKAPPAQASVTLAQPPTSYDQRHLCTAKTYASGVSSLRRWRNHQAKRLRSAVAPSVKSTLVGPPRPALHLMNYSQVEAL